MDIAQIFGDYLHLLGMIILLMKLLLTKNCAGISGKTQLLHALVSTTRYLDVTIIRTSIYDTILKIVFITITCITAFTIFLPLRNTYDRKRDGFRIELLILPSAVLALFLNRRFETFEVLNTFGAYLEAVAIVPQVYLVSKSKQIESIVVSYVACLGLYQGCYLMHWVYLYSRSTTPTSSTSSSSLLVTRSVNIDLACAIVQLIFYADFFARNLPILKAKGLPIPQSGSLQNNEDNHRLRRSKIVIPAGNKDDLNRPMESVLVVKPESVNAPEKVTLLAAKEAGTSN